MKLELSIDDQKRFWSKVRKTDYCWLWQGHINAGGYGVFSFSSTRSFAHRISYLLIHEEGIPDNEVIDHKCRTRNCVRPDHLWSIPLEENLRLRNIERSADDPDPIIQRKPLTQLQKCVNHLKEVFLGVAFTKYGSGDNSEKVLYDMVRLKLQESPSMFSQEKDLEQLIGGYKRKYFWRFDEILAEHNLHNCYSIIRKKLQESLSID